jgi:hypothetical protein
MELKPESVAPMRSGRFLVISHPEEIKCAHCGALVCRGTSKGSPSFSDVVDAQGNPVPYPNIVSRILTFRVNCLNGHAHDLHYPGDVALEYSNEFPMAGESPAILV